MSDDPFPRPSDPTPPDKPPTEEELFRLAEQARRDRLWDAAVRLHRQICAQFPNSARARIGLGRAYEGKSRGADERAFLNFARDEYHKAVLLEPENRDAHDALLALSVKTGALASLLEEYRARLKSEPGNAFVAATFRKAEALFLSQAEPKRALPNPPGMTRFLLKWFLPLAGVACLLLAMVFYFHAGDLSGPLEKMFVRSGAFLLVIYLVFRILLPS